MIEKVSTPFSRERQEETAWLLGGINEEISSSSARHPIKLSVQAFIGLT